MSAAQWVLVTCAVVFAASALRMIAQAVTSGGARDLASPKGRESSGIAYSFTAGMFPWKKESARRHPAVYVLGVAYHAGTFLAFFWLVALAVGAALPDVAKAASAGVLGVTALAGISLLVRRGASSQLRYFSSPDDYFSNLVVTAFHLVAAAALLRPSAVSVLLVYGGLLLVYIPLGKLRHALYFGLARYYLGRFYGRRGVWPAGGTGRWRTRTP